MIEPIVHTIYVVWFSVIDYLNNLSNLLYLLCSRWLHTQPSMPFLCFFLYVFLPNALLRKDLQFWYLVCLLILHALLVVVSVIILILYMWKLSCACVYINKYHVISCGWHCSIFSTAIYITFYGIKLYQGEFESARPVHVCMCYCFFFVVIAWSRRNSFRPLYPT